MTAYTKSTNFATKDTLASGDPLKIVKGTEINTEFDNIATAVNSKSDTASPTFTGTVTIPVLSVTGVSTLTGVATLTSQPILSSLTASKPVFTDASKGLVSTGTLGADQGGTGVANNAAMTVTGSGNFAYTRTLTAATNVTFPTTGTLSTLAGSETLTNKTLTNPTVTNYVESVVAIGTVTTSSTLSLTSGTVQTATLTASTACTFTMPTATAGKSFVLFLNQAATTGNGTATFTSVKWNSVGAPTITATAGKMDILSFIADGTNWYGSIAQGYTP